MTADLTIDRETLQLTMSRVFDAPRELVFKAYTDPELFARWWGPARYENIVEKFDVRPGGEWRVIQRAADGGTHVFYGVHREVVPPERIVATFEYEPFAGHVMVNTADFEDVEGKTRLTVTTQYSSIEDLEGMVQSGMESGARESWDRLAALLATV